METLAHFDLILASQSPRRSQLLSQAGIPFRVQAVPIEEDFPADLPVLEVAPYLAQQKAIAATTLLEKPEQILLTADSVVIEGETIYGKPKDREEAIAIISALAGKRHTVVTGVCLKSLTKEVTLRGISYVYFLPMSQAEIAYYVDRYQPYDKAGAYAIQEWIGLCKIHRIEGTYHNIMGLPVDLVYAALLAW